MKKEELELAKEMCEEEGLRTSIMQNMWLAFVVGAMRLLEMEGSIFFVLPMEFLQVQYAEKLREHLEKSLIQYISSHFVNKFSQRLSRKFALYI